jgi:hypothetical protein
MFTLTDLYRLRRVGKFNTIAEARDFAFQQRPLGGCKWFSISKSEQGRSSYEVVYSSKMDCVKPEHVGTTLDFFPKGIYRCGACSYRFESKHRFGTDDCPACGVANEIPQYVTIK